MYTAIRWFFPAIVAPVLALAATPASAAKLDISNGFLTAKTITANGYDFGMHLTGTIVNNGVSKATSIELDCVVDEVEENIDCDGTLTLGAASADIRMDFVSATETAHWSIESSASNALDVAHEAWGQDVVAASMGLPDGWASIDFFDGTQWRHFYYSTSWAETYENITGLPYGDIWEI